MSPIRKISKWQAYLKEACFVKRRLRYGVRFYNRLDKEVRGIVPLAASSEMTTDEISHFLFTRNAYAANGRRVVRCGVFGFFQKQETPYPKREQVVAVACYQTVDHQQLRDRSFVNRREPLPITCYYPNQLCKLVDEIVEVVEFEHATLQLTASAANGI